MMEGITNPVYGALIEVNKQLGPGLYEECYQKALEHELKLRGLAFNAKVKLPVVYKGISIKDAYEIDILVENSIIIELKSVEELSKNHFKQLTNYLHLSNLYLGYLVNFNTSFLLYNRDVFRVFNNESPYKPQDKK